MRKLLLLTLFSFLVIFCVRDESRAVVSTTVTSVDCTGSGGSTCTVTYPFLDTGDLVVEYYTGSCGSDTYTTYTENVDYTVTRIGDTGGTVTTTNPIASGYCLRVRRLMDVLQPSAITPQSHEDAVDRAIMLIQQAEIDATGLDGVTQIDFDAHLAAADPHDTVVLLAGRSGGTAIIGGTDSADNLELDSTSHATKGNIILGGTALYVDDVYNRVGINESSPAVPLHVTGSAVISGQLYGSTSPSGSLSLSSTSDATKGSIILASVLYASELNDCVGINGACTAGTDLYVAGDVKFSGGTNVDMDGLVSGGDDSGEDLELTSTSHATKGNIIFGEAGTSVYDETNDRFGIGTAAPTYNLDVVGTTRVTGNVYFASNVFGTNGGGTNDLLLKTNDSLGNIYFGNTTLENFDDATDLWGFGVATPTAKLDIYKDNPAGPVVLIKADGGTNVQDGIAIWAGVDAPAANDDIVWVDMYDGNGDQVGYLRYGVAGPGVEIHNPSDRRLKKNIRNTKVQGLATVNALRFREFDMRDNPTHCEIGLIAQEVQPIYPVAVSKSDKTGMLGMSQTAFIPVALKAIQELSAQVEAMQAEIDELHETCGR